MNQLEVTTQDSAALRTKYGEVLNDNQRLEQDNQNLRSELNELRRQQEVCYIFKQIVRSVTKDVYCVKYLLLSGYVCMIIALNTITYTTDVNVAVFKIVFFVQNLHRALRKKHSQIALFFISMKTARYTKKVTFEGD